MTDIASFQKRIRELEKENARLAHELSVKMDKYGLYWLDCPEAFDEESEDKIPVLEEVPDKEIRNDDGKPIHILIEGDNYHALTCLNFTHRGKIDVIYIDPPYNTGKDFYYKDKRTLEQYPNGEPIKMNHPLRHSAWLSFMEKRLKLAKWLLRDSGIIFISINDNEQANLKLLCDKIFREKNFITTFPRKGNGGRQDSDHYAIVHEYVLGYARDITKLKAGEMVYERVFPLYDESRKLRYKVQLLRKWGDKSLRADRPNLYYPIYWNPKTKEFSTKCKGKSWKGIYPMIDAETEGRWRWGKTTMNEAFAEGLVEMREDSGVLIPYERIYEDPDDTEETKLYSSWIDKIDNSTGTALLKDMIKDCPFEYPKPVDLIARLIQMGSKRKDCVVLDFFAGSGTTFHAVSQLNSKDGGTRQCLLCTNTENNICDGVTYPRVSKVINGYISIKGTYDELFREKITLAKLRKAARLIGLVEEINDESKGMYSDIKTEIKDGILTVRGKINAEESVPALGGSLKYYRTAFVGKHGCGDVLDEDRDELSANAGTMLALAEGTLDEVRVPKKTKDFWRHYTDGGHKHTFVYHSCKAKALPSLSREADKVRSRDKDAKLSVYIYTLGGSIGAFENEFDDMTNIELKEIPEPILKIYRTINGDLLWE